MHGMRKHRSSHGDVQDQEGVPGRRMQVLPHETTPSLHFPEAYRLGGKQVQVTCSAGAV